MIASLVTVFVVLVVVGALVWFINEDLPIAKPFKDLITIVAVIAVLLWVLEHFGLYHFSGFGS